MLWCGRRTPHHKCKSHAEGVIVIGSFRFKHKDASSPSLVRPYGCEKDRRFSLTVRIPYPGTSPPDTRSIILLISGRCSLPWQALSHTLHRWSAIGELLVS